MKNLRLSDIFGEPKNRIYKFKNGELSLPTSNYSFIFQEKNALTNNLGKILVNFDGKPMFAELAIRQILDNNGFDARWVATPSRLPENMLYLTDWVDKGKRFDDNQITVPLNYECQREMEHIKQIRGDGQTYKGCWDIVAWKNQKIHFIETKHKGKDRPNKNQKSWYLAARKVNIPKENLLVVEWEHMKVV